MLFAKIPYVETFRSGSRCPSALIRSGDKLMLIYDNSPIYFNDLEEYIAFVNELRSQGIDCPVAMLQEENGEFNTNAKILDASRDHGQYNKDSYPGFDPYGLHIGRYTELDKTHDSTANPNLSEWNILKIWSIQVSMRRGKSQKKHISHPMSNSFRT